MLYEMGLSMICRGTCPYAAFDQSVNQRHLIFGPILLQHAVEILP